MSNSRINPRTGRRFDWEEDQKKERELQAQLAALKGDTALVKRKLRALDAQTNLLAFTEFTMPDPEFPNDLTKSRYKAAKVHREVARILDMFIEDQLLFDDGKVCNQLIFCMPPRHGKSELVSRRLVARYMGMNPFHNVVVGAYSDTFAATELGAPVRAIIDTPQFKQVFPKFKLRHGGKASDNLKTAEGGGATFVGRGGAVTGKAGHLIILDDVFKGHAEARSQAVRDEAWYWFLADVLSRRMGKKKVILTMTRWHSDDVIGRITDPENPKYIGAVEAAKWKIIRIPAIAEDDDPLGREIGEPLWPDGPDTFNLEYLTGFRNTDALVFEALYQQNPTVADGIMFRRETLQFYEPDQLPADLRIYCSSDHAVGTKERNDPSCLIKVGVDKQQNIYILDTIWRRMPTDQAVEAMLAMAGGKQRPLIWWAERGHISKSIGPFLRKRMLETGVYINLVEVTPATDKETRAQSIAARAAMGKVFFPKNSWWTEKAINEMMAFPNGTHDDFVDAMAYIGLGLGSQVGPGSSAPKPKVHEGTFNWLKQNDIAAQAKRSAGQLRGF